MIAGYQRTVARGEFCVAVERAVLGHKIVSVQMRLALALAPASLAIQSG